MCSVGMLQSKCVVAGRAGQKRRCLCAGGQELTKNMVVSRISEPHGHPLLGRIIRKPSLMTKQRNTRAIQKLNGPPPFQRLRS